MAGNVRTKKGDAVVLVDPKKLTPYENNPRINDEAVEYVMKSIRAAADPEGPLETGFKDPIEVNEQMVIICGHTRQKAALELKLKTVPVIIHHFPTVEAENLYRLTNNKASEFGYWDQDKLPAELEPLADLYDLEDLGFLQEEYNDDEPEDESAEESVETYSEKEKTEFLILVTCATDMARDEAYTELVNSGYICKKI